MKLAAKLPVIAALLVDATFALAVLLADPLTSEAVPVLPDSRAEPAIMQPGAGHDARVKKITAPSSVDPPQVQEVNVIVRNGAITPSSSASTRTSSRRAV